MQRPQALPADVLLEIFNAYRRCCLDDITQGEASCKPYQWMLASHTCRHWRSVAIESPSLWALVVVTHAVECVKTMIKRSRNAPLIVRAHPAACKRAFEKDALDALFEVLHRVKDVDFSADSHSIAKLGHLPSAKSATSLETFQVYNQTRWSCGLGSPLAFITDAPNLRSLYLSGLNFVQSSRLVVPSLVSFTWEASNPVDPQHLLEALAPLKQLRELHLVRVFDDVVVSSLPSGAVTHEFPLLRKFTLSGGAIGCTWFLDHVKFSPETQMSVRAVERWDTDLPRNHILRLITSVASKFNASDEAASPLSCEILRGIYKHEIEARIWLSKLTSDSFVAGGTLPEPNVTIAVPLIDDNHYDGANTVIPKIFESFRLSDIQSLHIRSQAPQLQTLVTSNWMLDSLPKFLLSEAGSPVFPVLEVLGLKAARWTESDKATSLSSMLNTCQAQGSGITQLIVRDSIAVNEKDVLGSKGAIENLDWDGTVAPIPEEDDLESDEDE
ncbi:hypothetical protein QCA50_016306 [Cerrena zonata]|uniref:F-box domain-containing protein n=1 Tax=Cerrena zonata TaxID=2478898 RepID=A0AAW0FND7_9APHY